MINIDEMRKASDDLAAELAAARGREPIAKPKRSAPQLDDYTRERLEAFAAERGWTFDEAVAYWLKQHSIYFGYYRGN